MLETELRTLLSHPSQSIFTLISTVYNTVTKKKNDNQNLLLETKPTINTHTHTQINGIGAHEIKPALVSVSFLGWKLRRNLKGNQEHPFFLVSFLAKVLNRKILRG